VQRGIACDDSQLGGEQMKDAKTMDVTQLLCGRCSTQLLFSCVIAIACCSTKAAEQSLSSRAIANRETRDKLIRHVEDELERLRVQLKVPGMSVAIVKEHQILFAQGFGFADIENNVPATEHTPYHIASLTKPFAATVVMRMVEQGKLSLDSKMSDILADADFTVNGKAVHGYADLCKELKGLINYPGDRYVMKVRHHLSHTARGVPGEKYRYSGWLYGLLTEVLEKTSGKDFEQLLVDEIVLPLQMTDTVPNPSRSRTEELLEQRAKPYRIDATGKPILSRYPGRIRASAGIVSTVLDLAKFDMALDKNLIVSEKSKREMFTATVSNSGETLPYGLGWFVQRHQGVYLIWHYGWQPDAYSSLILKIPGRRATFVLLANSETTSAKFDLGSGNVLNSPFAALFLDFIAHVPVQSDLSKERGSKDEGDTIHTPSEGTRVSDEKK
jgi:CubicO group peptidase (beta-lactamase class C family)